MIGFAVCIVFAVLLTIRLAYDAPRRWFYLLKPLTTTLILFVAFLSPLLGWNSYAFWVLAGLTFSLVGDVFLMLSDKRFIWGLVSFLVAHLCYILAFTYRTGFRESPSLSLPFIAVGLIIATQIGARARRLRWPITLYTAILMTMAWRACAGWAFSSNSSSALLAGLGAILFVVSDTLLAINHFVRRFRWAQVAILGTYYAAQALIAWSAWPDAGGFSI